MTGALINTATVLVGSTIGTFLQSRFPECVRQIVMWGVALIPLIMGWGVVFAALTVLLYQGVLTVGASLVKTLLTDAMVAEMTATGGTLILAHGLNLLDLTTIRVANFLPALATAPLPVALLRLSGT